MLDNDLFDNILCVKVVNMTLEEKNYIQKCVESFGYSRDVLAEKFASKANDYHCWFFLWPNKTFDWYSMVNATCGIKCIKVKWREDLQMNDDTYAAVILGLNPFDLFEGD